MKNPHIAADGFTYEAEAIEDWLEAHDQSATSKLRYNSKLSASLSHPRTSSAWTMTYRLHLYDSQFIPAWILKGMQES